MSAFTSDNAETAGTSHLSSNNPFRNRAISPSPLTPTSPFADPSAGSSGRPVSRNPFLDPGNDAPKQSSGLLIDFDDSMASEKSLPAEASSSSITDLFSSLSTEEPSTTLRVPGSSGSRPAPPPPTAGQSSRRPVDGSGKPPYSRGPPPPSRGRGGTGGPPPPRAKNMPPSQSPPSGQHRPSRSQETSQHAVAESSRKPGLGDWTASRRPPPVSGRPRRNSESSVAGGHEHHSSRSDKTSRDARRREPEARDRGSSTRPNRRNDIIDQLDATSIFGTGLVFHHDGPFDALNPHRNRKGSRRAPMQAFPKDSLNNILGGSGPLNARPDQSTLMGESVDEAFKDFSRSRVEKPSASGVTPVFDPRERASILHGDETLGLGTSTFLEGAPAARTAVQRQNAEKAADTQEGSLQRKKSLAQRFRSINRGPRDQQARAFSTDGTPLPSSRYASGGSSHNGRDSPMNEYDSQGGEEVFSVRGKAPATTTASAMTSPGSPPSPPFRGLAALERRSTADGTDAPRPATARAADYYGSGDAPPPPAPPLPHHRSGSGATGSGGGLLARVKSLKGGRRAAPPPPPPISKES